MEGNLHSHSLLTVAWLLVYLCCIVSPFEGEFLTFLPQAFCSNNSSPRQKLLCYSKATQFTFKNLKMKLWYVRGSAEAADLETKGSGEMEFQAAALAYVLVSCKTTLHSLSLLYSGQRRDPKGVIQSTHFLDGKLLVKCTDVLVSHAVWCNRNG